MAEDKTEQLIENSPSIESYKKEELKTKGPRTNQEGMNNIYRIPDNCNYGLNVYTPSLENSKFIPRI